MAESSYGEVDTNGRRKDPQLKAVARKDWHAKLDLLTVSVLVLLQRQKIALILVLKTSDRVNFPRVGLMLTCNINM